MIAADFPRFEAILRRMEKLYAKKLDDELIQVYWHALRDLSLMHFERFAERHEKFGKFFPKPTELRPRDEVASSVSRTPAMDAAFRESERMCVLNLERLRSVDPDKWKVEVAMRKLDRTLAVTDDSSPIYAVALVEWQALRKQHGAIR